MMVSANEQVRQHSAANITARMVFSITCLLFLGWFLAVVTMMNECRTNLQACNLEICSEAASTSEERRHTLAVVQCPKSSQANLELFTILFNLRSQNFDFHAFQTFKIMRCPILMVLLKRTL